jgi:hypothetical protein
MSTLTINNSTSNLFTDIFKVNKPVYIQKVSNFIKDKNTKANALLAYWGAETIIDSVLAFALFVSGTYLLSFLAFALAAYRTYAILGVLSDIKQP